jgi:4-amino-4-deoxy-L-arabinose transferase-like glycosyltransferase
MFDLAGLTTISLLSLMVILTGMKWRAVSKIIYVAFLVRILFLLINNYFFSLPDADMDAVNFEWWAWQWSRDGFFNVFDYYNGPDAYFISFVIAIPYSLFGRSILMAQSFSIFFGIGSVFLGWLLAKKLWDEKTAKKVGWAIALFPAGISYSVIIMREPYISFFLLLAIYGLVNWIRVRGLKNIIITFFGFMAATFFHGASVVGLVIFLLLVLYDSIKKSFKLLKARIISFQLLVIIILFSIIINRYLTNKISIPYLKNFKTTSDIENIKFKMEINAKGDASYPAWLKVADSIEFIWKLPIRAIYFISAPFPWDVKKTTHLVGTFDGLLYVILLYLIFCNRKNIYKDPALQIILLILVCYFIAFSIGVSNFGTGIRHRSKFAFELILLAGPLIPNFFFLTKQNFKNTI